MEFSYLPDFLFPSFLWRGVLGVGVGRLLASPKLSPSLPIDYRGYGCPET